jgi:hypothetical protein
MAKKPTYEVPEDLTTIKDMIDSGVSRKLLERWVIALAELREESSVNNSSR